jgi:hypothetical protein
MRVINQQVYDSWKAKNSDPYGSATFRYAEKWADMMEEKIEAGEKLDDIADKLSHDADVEGITGFMYGCAVSILSQCWQFGEDLRVWHNAQYNHNGSGVVNPAILTVETKE